MYRKIFIVSVLLTLSANNLIFSQQKVLPGAVEDPLFWIKSRNNGEAYYWETLSKNDAKIATKKQNGTAFNFNPSIVFDTTQDSLILPLGIESKRKQTLFMVYKVKDSLKEQFLWNALCRL